MNQKLLLIDGFGALLSFLIIGICGIFYPAVFNIPIQTVYLLLIFPIIFVLLDFYAYCFDKFRWKTFLAVVAFGNLFYACLSVILIVIHSNKLSILGWAYFATEIAIILCLTLIEFKAIGKKNQPSKSSQHN